MQPVTMPGMNYATHNSASISTTKTSHSAFLLFYMLPVGFHSMSHHCFFPSAFFLSFNFCDIAGVCFLHISYGKLKPGLWISGGFD